ncbi:MAG: hydroxymethylbilane synthase [Desulfamplus sp.]|nr:hydroxymethylbilane synthase [Desulfamplus sp.]
MTRKIKIGTRGSQLALWQANWVKQALEKGVPCQGPAEPGRSKVHPVKRPLMDTQPVEAEIVIIRTTGDRITDRPLALVGGKGLFVKEIEQQLLDGDVDIAVHSMKDMPGELPRGLKIGAVPARENPFDVLISRNSEMLENLPPGSRVGTSSLRRASQIKHARPDLEILSIRGNLDTRLKKLDSGEYDAIILAAAGLIRLGMASRITQFLDADIMLPAVGQGALCIESRNDDPMIDAVLQSIGDPMSRLAVEAERSFLKKLEGSCHIPVACFGTVENEMLTLTGLVASCDGRAIIKETMTQALEEKMGGYDPDMKNISGMGGDELRMGNVSGMGGEELHIENVSGMGGDELHMENVSGMGGEEPDMENVRRMGEELAISLIDRGAKNILENIIIP